MSRRKICLRPRQSSPRRRVCLTAERSHSDFSWWISLYRQLFPPLMRRRRLWVDLIDTGDREIIIRIRRRSISHRVLYFRVNVYQYIWKAFCQRLLGQNNEHIMKPLEHYGQAALNEKRHHERYSWTNQATNIMTAEAKKILLSEKPYKTEFKIREKSLQQYWLKTDMCRSIDCWCWAISTVVN